MYGLIDLSFYLSGRNETATPLPNATSKMQTNKLRNSSCSSKHQFTQRQNLGIVDGNPPPCADTLQGKKEPKELLPPPKKMPCPLCKHTEFLPQQQRRENLTWFASHGDSVLHPWTRDLPATGTVAWKVSKPANSRDTLNQSGELRGLLSRLPDYSWTTSFRKKTFPGNKPVECWSTAQYIAHCYEGFVQNFLSVECKQLTSNRLPDFERSYCLF